MTICYSITFEIFNDSLKISHFINEMYTNDKRSGYLQLKSLYVRETTSPPGGASLSGEDGADVVELVEGRHGGEVVDVEVEDFVAQLSEHRVVELEE